MTIPKIIVKQIIKLLLIGEDYRVVIVDLINADFLQHVMAFFRKVIDAKLMATEITPDWYQNTFLSTRLASDELILNSGLNKKTIENMYNSSRREVVLSVVNENHEKLLGIINELVADYRDMEIKLTLRFREVSIDLNISESLIVINALAVKRAAIRGGAWSSVGKQVEKSLLLTLCEIYSVPAANYQLTGRSVEGREIDFFLKDQNGLSYRCEVKLMGKGNPESADAFYARDSQIFIADKLSDSNKRQLNTHGIHWVELRGAVGIAKFGEVLATLQIPCNPAPVFTDRIIDEVLTAVLDRI